MKKRERLLSLTMIFILIVTGMLLAHDNQTPLVEKFTVENRVRSGVALGGIGTGSVELRKDGKFYNWAIFNNYPKGTGPVFAFEDGAGEDIASSNLFFVVRYEVEGEQPQMRLLQINDGLNEGGETGAIYYFPWLEAVECIEYSARFPFVNMKFTDKDMPFDIHLEAFSPFIPHDIKHSSLPLVYFNFKLDSKTDKDVDVMLIASLRNNVGYETKDRYFVTEVDETDTYKLISMSCNMDNSLTTYGQQVIASLDPNSTYYGGWSHRHPYYEYLLRHKTLPNFDDTDGVKSIAKTHKEIPLWMPRTNGRNIIDKQGNKKAWADGKGNSFMNSSVAISKKLGDGFKHSFVMTWNFPNQYAEGPGQTMTEKNEGHYYSNFFETAAEVADYGISNKKSLTKRSKAFLNNFFNSSLDTYVLEQVNSQLNTFITSARLDKEGYFGVQEGLAPNHSWGPIATTDVSLYGSVPVLALFPELQKNMMRAHKNVQAPGGEIAHGLHKNFHMWEDGTAGISHRRDLPGQFVIMTLRDYFWTHDTDYLKEMWPAIQKALNYALSDDIDRNGDLMPDMLGNRSSYDNFPMFGLSSYIQSQWLCAMASAALAAEELGDAAAQKKYTKIARQGKKLMDKYLWNGKYYRLYHDYDKTMDKYYAKEGNSIRHFEERMKKDEGCMTDQIIGQWAAHLSGLGYLMDPQHVHKALMSVMEMSYFDGFGLRNASWPGTGFVSDIPRDMWVDQGNTPWTGVELEFASFLIYEGLVDDGLKVIKSVDDRYRKSGLYWDHQEFGGHYYRPMSAWAILNAMLGLGVNQETYSFNPKLNDNTYTLFFSFNKGTAHYMKREKGVAIEVLTGEFTPKNLKLTNAGIINKNPEVYVDGMKLDAEVKVKGCVVNVALGENVVVKAGSQICVE